MSFSVIPVCVQSFIDKMRDMAWVLGPRRLMRADRLVREQSLLQGSLQGRQSAMRLRRYNDGVAFPRGA